MLLASSRCVCVCRQVVVREGAQRVRQAQAAAVLCWVGYRRGHPSLGGGGCVRVCGVVVVCMAGRWCA